MSRVTAAIGSNPPCSGRRSARRVRVRALNRRHDVRREAIECLVDAVDPVPREVRQSERRNGGARCGGEGERRDVADDDRRVRAAKPIGFDGGAIVQRRVEPRGRSRALVLVELQAVDLRESRVGLDALQTHRAACGAAFAQDRREQ
jgi:hypothetical protein